MFIHPENVNISIVSIVDSARYCKQQVYVCLRLQPLSCEVSGYST